MQTQVSRKRSLRASDLVMEGMARDRASARLIANLHTPENDSVAEDIIEIAREYGVPRHRVKKTLALLAEFFEVRKLEVGNYHALSAELAALDATSATSVVQSFTVRGVVSALGEPTRTLADARRGVEVDADALAHARAVVLDAARSVPRETLLSGSVERQLRGRRFAEIVAACDAVDGVKAAG